MYLVLATGLFCLLSVARHVEANAELNKWSRVNIPAGGDAGGWVLAAGSDIRHPVMSNDGAIYAFADPSDSDYTLYKSVDSGRTWKSIGAVTDSIIDISLPQGDSNLVYYTTQTAVHKSIDGGESFGKIASSPGGAGTGNISITSLDVTKSGSSRIIAIGTVDSDSSQFGGVYILDEKEIVPVWEDTGLTGFDSVEVKFSPTYNRDRQLLAVTTDEQDTVITGKIADGEWGAITANAVIEGIVPDSAAFAFPSDYDITNERNAFFLGLDTIDDTGDAFKISWGWAPEISTVKDLDAAAENSLADIDLTSLAVLGNADNATLIAGAAGSAQVYISTDSGENWAKSKKEPTGQSKTFILLAEGFANSRKIYALTSGAESGFSVSADFGDTWNQVSMLDSAISSNGIVDLSVSPYYGNDETLYMLTFDSVNTEHSLWRSLNGGGQWERIFSSTFPGINTFSKVRISPDYGLSSDVIYLTGTANGAPALWKSTDKGQTFTRRTLPLAADVLAVVDDDTLLIGSYNGSSGLVYKTTNSGTAFSEGTPAGSLPLSTLVLSPGFEKDGNILAGNTDGWVYLSGDNGSSFKSVPLDAGSPPFTGSVYAAFSPDFIDSNIIYAASSTADKGVYRFTMGESTFWEQIDATLPAGGALGTLIVSGDGVMYASNTQAVNSANKLGGLERSLNPDNASAPKFETITSGLEGGTILNSLSISGDRLWAIDTAHTRVMTYRDSLGSSVGLNLPGNDATDTGITNVILDWTAVDGATEYRWQLDYDTSFSAIQAGFNGSTKASSVRLPELDPGTTYYWRVRASKPLLGRWSNIWSFNTGSGTMAGAPQLVNPKPGATGLSVKPIFQWNPVSGADAYELVVSKDYTFGNPSILKVNEYALPSTAWQSTISLDYDTVYYWKVRAVGPENMEEWSAVGAFTTGSEPVKSTAGSDKPDVKTTAPEQVYQAPAEDYTEPVTSPATAPLLPNWLLILGGGLLVAILILLVVLLVLVVTIRRSSTG